LTLVRQESTLPYASHTYKITSIVEPAWVQSNTAGETAIESIWQLSKLPSSISSGLKWYKGIPPGGVLVDSTDVAAIEISSEIGTNDYYVIVSSENCISLASAKSTIVVLETPVAMVNDPFINLCAGEDILLGTEVSGPGYEYLWWGPDSYQSSVQNPGIIEDVDIKNQGTYRLAIFNDICSDTALVEVIVNERPVAPIISSDSIYCEGETIVLSVGNITNADTYSWFLNGDLYTVENTNTLVIPNANSSLSGAWSGVAKEGNCYSDTSEIKIIDVEIRYEISASNSGPVCEGDSVQLIAPEIPGAQYTWISPDNDSLYVARPELIADSGLYQLEVITQAGCLLTTSTEVEVVKVPTITALSNSAPECIDGSECIEFKPSVFPNLANYTYSWSGPNEFESFDSIAVICDADTVFNGLYQLIVSNGSCHSEMAETEVLMHVFPDQPELIASTQICENDTLVLNMTNMPEDVIQFFWSTPNGNVYQTSEAELILPQAELSYTGFYSVQSFNGYCYSPISDSLYIEVLKKPNQPVAWTEQAFCEGEAITLFTTYIEGAEYFWEGPNDFEAYVQNPVISPSDTLDQGVYRLTISVNGCISEVSEGVVVNIKPKPLTPAIVGDIPAQCIEDASTSFELCLENQLAAANYTWYHNDSGEEIGYGSSSCLTVSNINGIIDGINGFYVVADLDGCKSDRSELVQVQLDLIPDKIADAGEDIIVCNDDDLYLGASPDPDGYWMALNNDILITDSNDPESRILKLVEGDNHFVWSLSHGVCYDYDNDTMLVHIIRTPKANDDVYITAYDQNVDIEPAINDDYAEYSEVIIDAASVTYGEIESIGINSYTFDPFPTFVGEIWIPYTLVHNECREKFSEALINIKISDANDCFGVNVITPNGDGVNDALLFPCLENPLFPKNKLLVFNQWGDEVFFESPYRNDWQGTYQGKDLPVGTYYYILDLRNGSEPIRDFFVIER